MEEQIKAELTKRVVEIERRCVQNEITDTEASTLMQMERKIADRKMRDWRQARRKQIESMIV